MESVVIATRRRVDSERGETDIFCVCLLLYIATTLIAEKKKSYTQSFNLSKLVKRFEKWMALTDLLYAMDFSRVRTPYIGFQPFLCVSGTLVCIASAMSGTVILQFS